MMTTSDSGRGTRLELEERSFACIMAARERIRGVLEPELGPHVALERANNIAQALALSSGQYQALALASEQSPAFAKASCQSLLVALDMLRIVPEERRVTLARDVSAAWLALEPA
jgi:hypothetical protein